MNVFMFTERCEITQFFIGLTGSLDETGCRADKKVFRVYLPGIISLSFSTSGYSDSFD